MSDLTFHSNNACLFILLLDLSYCVTIGIFIAGRNYIVSEKILTLAEAYTKILGLLHSQNHLIVREDKDTCKPGNNSLN